MRAKSDDLKKIVQFNTCFSTTDVMMLKFSSKVIGERGDDVRRDGEIREIIGF